MLVPSSCFLSGLGLRNAVVSHSDQRRRRGQKIPRASNAQPVLLPLDLEHLEAAAKTVVPEGPPACLDVSAYYAPAKGLEGAALKERLHDVISPHKVFSYVQAWDALKVLDAADDKNPETSQNVIEIYSRKAVPKSLQADPLGWDREHLWPRSYGLVPGEPEFSDLHNLRPSDVNVNSARGNKWYGECSQFLDSKSSCLVPANKEAAPDTAASKLTWTPPAEVRGDIARALLYMDVRYNEKDGSSFDLELTDKPNIERAQMGLLSVLLKWHWEDPPSASERFRNSRVCQLYQRNRDPFVDHPEFVPLIWGEKNAATQNGATQNQVAAKTQGGSVVSPGSSSLSSSASASSSSASSGRTAAASAPTVDFRGPLPAWLNELHYENSGPDEQEFLEVAIRTGSEPQSISIVLYNGKKGDPYATFNISKFAPGIKAGNYSLFHLTLPSNGMQNGPDGVALVQRTAEGEKVIQFLSYEGDVVAASGPAKGFKSVDIGVAESNKSVKTSSLGLAGRGKEYKQFKWQVFKNASPGKLNVGQSIAS